MKQIQIAIVASKVMAKLVRQMLPQLQDDQAEVRLIETTPEAFYIDLDALPLHEIDIFVSSGIYGHMLKNRYDIPVIFIRKSPMDYLLSVLKVRNHYRNILVTAFRDELPVDYDEIRKITGVSFTNILMTDIDELREVLQSSDYDVVIGSGLAVEAAEEMGIHGFLVYNGRISVMEAILSAKDMVITAKDRKRIKSFSETILNFCDNGILLTDENGVITKINPSAEVLLRSGRTAAIRGSKITDLFPKTDFSPVLIHKRSPVDLDAVFLGQSLHLSITAVESDADTVGYMILLKPVVTEAEKRKNKKKDTDSFTAKNSFSDIVGNSYVLKEQILKAKKYSRTDANILITGESGVGKEIFAQSIHAGSNRYRYPFVAVNCAALPPSILESELFGYEEGAFTGTRKGGHKGLFELADNGTIFLDEIGEIPFELQSRLLRVLQEKEVLRLGGEKSIPVNVRIICATNRDLEAMIPNQFREDLFYRIGVLQIELPPLRARGDDIFELFRNLVYRNYHLQNALLTNENLRILRLYSWPGNIRELQNVVTRFIIEMTDIQQKVSPQQIHASLISAIGQQRLVNNILSNYGIEDPAQIPGKMITGKLIDDLNIVFPRQHEKVAEILGISRTTLWRRLVKNEALPKLNK